MLRHCVMNWGFGGWVSSFVGCVVIGKPKWHVCKASYCGSKQQ